MRLFGAFIIARLTFREAARRRILLAALLLGAIFLAIYGVGVYFIQKDLMRYNQHLERATAVPIYNFLTLSGLYVVNFLTSVLTVEEDANGDGSVETTTEERATLSIASVFAMVLDLFAVVLDRKSVV